MTVQKNEAGIMAGEALRRHFACSRNFLKMLRLYGRLLINGVPSRMKTPVREGDVLEACDLRRSAAPLLHIPATLPPLYQNGDLLVLNKPAGYVVHPSLNPALPSLTTALSDDPLHPVSRLDRDTTGLVLIALNAYTHERLSRQNMQKRYLALVHGDAAHRLQNLAQEGLGQLAGEVRQLRDASGQIRYLLDLPIRRQPESLMLREVHPLGKPSRTLCRVLRYLPSAELSLLECQLLSGRTHQIRVHCAALGLPLLGDSLYQTAKTWSASDQLLGRQALHAFSLQFRDPRSGRQISVEAPLPADFSRFLISPLISSGPFPELLLSSPPPEAERPASAVPSPVGSRP